MKSIGKSLGVALLFSLFAMAQVLPHFATRKFGPNVNLSGSDSYAFLHSLWTNAQPADGRIRSEKMDLLQRYPTGAPLLHHVQFGSAVANELAVLGCPPVAAYNSVILFCFFAAFFLGFLIAREMGLSEDVAYLCAFLVGLNPFQTLQAADHIDLAVTGAVLLNIFLLFRLIVKKQDGAAPLLLLTTALAIFTHPYFIICLAILNAIPLSVFAIRCIRRGRAGWNLWVQLFAAGLFSLSLFWYWKLLFALNASYMGKAIERDPQDLYLYSTKIADFILPPHFSLLFSPFAWKWKATATAAGGSNFVENTLYPGALVLAGTALAIGVRLARGRRAFAGFRRSFVFFFVLVIVVPIFFSLSPTVDFFDFRILTPSSLYSSILPQFRTLSRFGYIASLGLVFLFALQLEMFSRRWLKNQWIRRFVLVMCAGFTVLDLGYFHRYFYTDTSIVPPVYEALKNTTPQNAVVFEAPVLWGYVPMYWLNYTKRPHFGLFDPADPDYPAAVMASRGSYDQILAFARQRGANYLIIHSTAPLSIPAQPFVNEMDERVLFNVFLRYSYLVKIQ